MPIGDLNDREAVLEAIREYDQLGQAAFLDQYGYRPSRSYLLEFDGRTYDSKAIAGVAFGKQFPESGALAASEFVGGAQTVKPVLERMGFTVRDAANSDKILTEDVNVLRNRRGGERYTDLSETERISYQHIHAVLGTLGNKLVDRLKSVGQFSLKLTSGFNPISGVRGALPKDLWFSVSNINDAALGMPQLFMIVSSRGIEFGFAPAIHPRDFSDQSIRAKVLDAAPRIFASLPSRGSPEATDLADRLNKSGHWFYRRKTRLEPEFADLVDLPAWLDFLKSPEGGRWAGGAISQYIAPEQVEESDLSVCVETLADVFGFIMQRMENTVVTGLQDIVRPLLEEFLVKLPDARAQTAFGQHSDLKMLMRSLAAGLEGLPALKQRPHVRVSWSLGAGNWAKIPWIGLLDERETDSTQRGIYGVFLFKEDMTGVYLTLNQGVTETINEHGRIVGRKLLKGRASHFREEASNLAAAGFVLGDDIDLATEGMLGTDYEASTVSYKYYPRGSVPNDDEINRDLTNLLDAYALILANRTEPRGANGYWIFQANPARFDIDGAVADLADITWAIREKKRIPRVGDKVFFWRSGRDAGIVATGSITAPVEEIGVPENQLEFVRDRDAFDTVLPRVWVHIDQRVLPVLSRSTVSADPRLQDLMILRFAQYGTFVVSELHAKVLQELIDEDEEVAEEIVQRVWVYAPGKDAEFWDDFYEQGLIAIGWDELGDLKQFGSSDEVLAALDVAYPSAARQTNNAKTCFDFAHKMKVGDLVFARRGRSLVVGHGVVMGDYEFRQDRAYYDHVRTIRWESRGEWPTPEPMAIKTLTDITASTEFVEQLKRLVAPRPVDLPAAVPAVVREPYDLEAAMAGLFWPQAEFERGLKIWRNKKNLILQGAPGVGKTFVARRLAYALMGYRDPSRVRTVQFHQSYSYEDFVQGYRPDGDRGFELKPGVFFEFCERARADDKETYVFIIDEINRGNLSRIFGELMLLIEPDKRSSDWATKLAYARSGEERFYVPNNVFILGMMNTADRSLSMVDYALRRRFGFITLRPQYAEESFKQKLEQAGATPALVAKICDRMTELNQKIADDKTNLGSGFCLGHSFFVPLENLTPDHAWYNDVVETEIVPLLEEYWGDDPDKVSQVRLSLLAD